MKLTPRERKLIVAEVIRISTEVLFKNHLYTFGGKVFKQKEGGPIGLRGTCAVARLTMNFWDRGWKKKMEENRIIIKMFKRYMDDGRAFIAALKQGWRWIEGELLFKKAWQEEDENLTGLEVTRRALEKSMQEVVKCLNFTTEVGEEQDEG